MKKLRTFYDIFSIIVILVLLIQLFLGVDLSFSSALISQIILMAVVGLYALSIIILTVYLLTKEKEVLALVLVLIGSIIIPVILPTILYLFVMRKMLANNRR